MKKKIFTKAAFAFPIGITVGHLITIFISASIADGNFYPCVPELVSAAGSEIRAVILQSLLCGILSSGFAASSMIWENDNWCLAKQTGIYFLAVSVLMFPIAYFMHWMEHSITGFLIYFGIFTSIFAIVWAIQLAIGKHRVKQFNKNLYKVQN